MKRVLLDQHGGIIREVYVEDPTKDSDFKHVLHQDVDDIVRFRDHMRNHVNQKHKEVQHVARIPKVVYEAACEFYGVDRLDQEQLDHFVKTTGAVWRTGGAM